MLHKVVAIAAKLPFFADIGQIKRLDDAIALMSPGKIQALRATRFAYVRDLIV